MSYKLRLNCSILIASVLFGCGSLAKKAVVNDVKQLETDFQNHSGFVLYDPIEDKTVIDYHGDKYFTPASNTKILTFFLSSQILGDSIPGLYYTENKDSLIFWGSGDPTFLYNNLPQGNILDYLKGKKQALFFSASNYQDNQFGPGWAWDDYYYSFSSEKSPFPIYGNTVHVSYKKGQDHLSIDQPIFKSNFWLGDSIKGRSTIVRAYDSNHFIYYPSRNRAIFSKNVPFHYSDQVFTSLLEDTLKAPVHIIDSKLPANHQTLFSISTESAYREMMKESDNFIAEQLLLTCAGVLSDTLNSDIAIQYGLTKLMQNSPDPLIWVDGSGLSRYNLFTPRSLVWIWSQLYHSMPQEKLFSIIANGGEKGTLKNYYANSETYIYGKTGTLSNNHNLSGFLRTKRGKLYIFAFMNNNYPSKSAPVKKEMERILQEIHENN